MLPSARPVRRALLLPLLALSLIVIAGCGDDEVAGKSAGLRRTRTKIPVPAFTFQDQRGEKLGRDDLLGKVLIVDFIFTRCASICPDMTQKMKLIQDATKEEPDLHFVSVTVTPQNDSVKDLYAYGERFGVDHDRWHFLRGDLKATKELVVKGFLVGDIDEPMNHSEKFILVDREGFIRGYYDGRKKAEREALLIDARKLLAGEAL